MTDIRLRPWSTDDLEDLIAIFRASRDLETQYPMAVRTLAEARECLDSMLQFTEQHKAFAIVQNDRCVGNVAITHIERRHDTGWVSYFSSATVRGQGLVRRSLVKVANWALTDLGLFRLELGHRTNNPASGAVATAAGFHPEGLERQKLRYGDERFDVRTMARLATDPFPTVDPGITFDTLSKIN
ncbi:GNAT family N-acetyltransferase [Propionibacteriaceae bacterium Y1700]|uniref:GNAT family N-acetyltransferase n=1 Tax=Microlunatus sp. Y1700 TaxID=3418487 RepID=UPI003DA7869E